MACTCAPFCPESKGTLASDLDILSARGCPETGPPGRWEVLRSGGA